MSYGMRLMECAAAVSTAFSGAAQFSAGSSSEIELTSLFPNEFAADGDYIEFDLLVDSWSTYTVFGSTLTPDAIYLDADTIYVTDGTTTTDIDFDSSLTTGVWYEIKLWRDGSTLKCNVDSVTQIDTDVCVEIDINLIGKNRPAYSDRYSIQFYGDESQYLSKSSPSTAIQGADTGFWRFAAFELTEAGNQTIADNLSGNDGWRLEVVNIYFSTHRLRFTVGNGTETVSLDSTETFAVGDTVFAYVDLEDLGETTPGVGDTTIEGTFSPYSTNFYVGITGGATNPAYMKLKTLVGGDGNLTSDEQTWLINNGEGRALDEITVSSEVTTSEIDFGYTFSESSGTRADEYGTDDLTENPGYLITGSTKNADFEVLDGSGGFGTWTEFESGTSTVEIESSTQYAGSYSARLDIDASNSLAYIRQFSLGYTEGVEYTLRVYSKVTGALGSIQFACSFGGTSGNITYSSNDWTQYSTTRTVTNDAGILQFANPTGTGASRSFYFDNLELSRTSIPRSDGLRLAYQTAASFSGYLRNVTLHTALFESVYQLHQNANDSSIDGNDGTAVGITFVGTDPGA